VFSHFGIETWIVIGIFPKIIGFIMNIEVVSRMLLSLMGSIFSLGFFQCLH
jgi:hypothetical protein